MAKYFACLLLLLKVGTLRGQDNFRLAPPLLQYPSVFFKMTAKMSILFAQPGTAIRYTLNGNEPSETDSVYTSPLIINTHLTTVKAKTFGKGFLPSETVGATFVKEGYTIISTTHTPPDPAYSANGGMALFDNQGGVANVNSGFWLGYKKDTVAITIYLQRKQTIASVLLSMLQDHNAWVFLPQHVGLFYFDERANKFKSWYSKSSATADIKTGSTVENYIIAPSKKIKTGIVKIVMVPLQSLPANHPGHGTPGWLFIDEIKVY